jgi:shikimate dehydrogenase
VHDWKSRSEILAEASLLVNTTQLGLAGQPPLEIDLARLPVSAVVDDIVYVPMETPLLAAAKKRGNAVVDGLGMLLHQARPGFAAWFKVEPDVTPALRDFVLADIPGAK